MSSIKYDSWSWHNHFTPYPVLVCLLYKNIIWRWQFSRIMEISNLVVGTEIETQRICNIVEISDALLVRLQWQYKFNSNTFITNDLNAIGIAPHFDIVPQLWKHSRKWNNLLIKHNCFTHCNIFNSILQHKYGVNCWCEH